MRPGFPKKPAIFRLTIGWGVSSIHFDSSTHSTRSTVNQRLSHSLVKLLAGCAILFVADHFASRAWAGCGDHVKSARERADAGRSTPEMPSHVPCSGPMCSQSKDVPSTPPAPVPDQDERGLLSTRFTPPADPLTAVLANQSFLPLSGPVSSIFDPPRPAAR